MMTQKSKTRSGSTPDVVQAAICEVRRLYALGCRAWRVQGERVEPHWYKTAAPELGTTPNLLRQARRLAHPKNGLRPKEFARVIGLCRKAEFPPNFTVLYKSVSIADRKSRLSFIRRAIDGRWSSHRARLELLNVRGRRPLVGKKPALASDQAGALRQIESMSFRWNRLLDRLAEEQGPDDAPQHATMTDLPPKVADLLRQIEPLMAALQRRTEHQLGRP